MTHRFLSFKLKTSCLSENCDAQFPTALHGWDGAKLRLAAEGTHFGFVQRGAAVLQCAAGEFRLRAQMYFSVPGELEIAGGAGVIITRLDYRGLFNLGGAIEKTGRLRYIDGCTDTLLVAPPMLGDPCLNALYFPAGIRQTPHSHPSVRVGIVAEGAGECVTPEQIFPLRTGDAFIIAPDALHSFNTAQDQMTVIAYHPDSDFGATHENHPMINRTLVNGVSAAQLDDIKTR